MPLTFKHYNSVNELSATSVIYCQAMAMELMWPYIKDHPNPSVKGYLLWAKEQQDCLWAKEQQNCLYQTKYEQVTINFYWSTY
jgi:hypothetical protein